MLASYASQGFDDVAQPTVMLFIAGWRYAVHPLAISQGRDSCYI
jgi:hypothetical protein